MPTATTSIPAASSSACRTARTLYTRDWTDRDLPRPDTSWQHAALLFRCIDESVNSAYGDSLDNESRFDGEIRGMSPSTRRILASVEYEALRLRRRANYEALHAALARTMRWTARPTPMR